MMNGRKIAGLVGTTAILIQVQFHYWVYRWKFSINSAALGDADSSPFLPSIKYHGPPVVLCSRFTASRPWTNYKNVTCSDLILSSFSDYPSLLRAQRNISTGIQECEPCHPRSCGADTQPADQLRFVDAAPRIIRTIDHVLRSIPADILGAFGFKSSSCEVKSNHGIGLQPNDSGYPSYSDHQHLWSRVFSKLSGNGVSWSSTCRSCRDCHFRQELECFERCRCGRQCSRHQVLHDPQKALVPQVRRFSLVLFSRRIVLESR